MFKTILVGIDGSEHADKALDIAADLAQKYEARLLVVHVLTRRVLPAALRPYAGFSQIGIEDAMVRIEDIQRLADAEDLEVEHVEAYRKQVAHNLLSAAVDRARAAGASRVEQRLERGRPASGIVRLAKAEEVELIVLGSRGLGDVAGAVIGSVTHRVGHAADVPVLTVK
ncbi:MAG: universal stress protein [Gammaproteobacteria bacterium]|nr:universal stress protein [Gammaproteobacteria bacterium]